MSLRTPPFRAKPSRILAAALAIGSMIPTALFAPDAGAAEPVSAGTLAIISTGAGVLSAGVSAAQASQQGGYKHPEINQVTVAVAPAGIVVADQAQVTISVGGSFGSCDDLFDSPTCGHLDVDFKTRSNPTYRTVFTANSRGATTFSYTRQVTVEGWKDGAEKVTVRIRLNGEDNQPWFFDKKVPVPPQVFEKQFNVQKPFVLEAFANGQKFEQSNSTSAITITHGQSVRTKLRVARYNSPGKDGRAYVYRAAEYWGKLARLAGTTAKPDYTTLVEQLHFHGAHNCDTEPTASFELVPFYSYFTIDKSKFTNKPTDYADLQFRGPLAVVCKCPESATGWLAGRTDIVIGTPAGRSFQLPRPKAEPPSEPAEPADSNPTEPRDLDWWFNDWYQSPYVPRKVGLIDPRSGERTELPVDSDGHVTGRYTVPEYAVLDVDAGPAYRNIHTLIHTPSMAEYRFNMIPEMTPTVSGTIPNAAGGNVYLIPGDEELQAQVRAWLADGGDELERPEWLEAVPSDAIGSGGSFELNSVSRLEMGVLSGAALLVRARAPLGRTLAKGGNRLMPLDIRGKEPMALGTLEGFDLAQPQDRATSTLTVGSLYYADGLTGKKLPLSYTKFVVRDAETQKVLAVPATDKYGALKLELPTARPVVMTLANPEAALQMGLAPMTPLELQLDHDVFFEERAAGQMSVDLQKLEYDGHHIFVAGQTNGDARALLVVVNGSVAGKLGTSSGYFEGAVKVGRLEGSTKVQVFQVFKDHTGAPATRMLDADGKADGGEPLTDDANGCSIGGTSSRGGFGSLILLGFAALLVVRRRRKRNTRMR